MPPSCPCYILGMWHNSLGLYRAVSHPGVTNDMCERRLLIYYAARWKSKMMVIAVWAAKPCVQFYLLGKTGTAGQANSSDEKFLKWTIFSMEGRVFLTDQRTASRRLAIANAPSNFRKCWIRPGCWAPNCRSGWRGCGRAGPGPSKDRLRKLDSHTVPSARRTTIRHRCRTSRWDNCQVVAPLLNQCKWLFVQPFLNWKLKRIDSRYFIKM